MNVATVAPGTYRQYTARHHQFCLVTDDTLTTTVQLAEPDNTYSRTTRINAPAGTTLADLLTSRLPDNTDVLILTTRTELTTAPTELISDRTIAVLHLPDNNTTTAAELLQALQDSDPQHDSARRLRSALETGQALSVTDQLTGVAAALTPGPGATRITADLGPFQPGTLHHAPNGWITLSTHGTLPLNGQIAVKGRPTVHHSNNSTATAAERQRAYEGLLPLTRYPLVLTIENGTVTDIKAVDGGSDNASHTLQTLFDQNPHHRRITAIGFGLNPAVPALRANTTTHHARATTKGPTAHLTLGGLDGTLQLHLPLDSSRIETTDGHTLAPGTTTRDPAETNETGDSGDSGDTCAITPPTTTGRKLNRVRSASCGCH